MENLIKPAPHFPAPWTLKGEGIILVYKFNRKWVEENGLLAPHLKGNFIGGLGFVMLVNYHESPVGPYKELLIIPGKFKPHKKQSISKIYVDSEESTKNGRHNWGIPKETVPMIWHSEHNVDSIGIGEEKDPILFCKVKTKGIPFPATTSLMPIQLFQQWQGYSFLTKPKGTGWAKLVEIEKLKVDGERFPDIGKVKPLIGFKVNSFTMNFPVAVVYAHKK